MPQASHEFGNKIPNSYLIKLYGKDHWVNQPESDPDVSDDVQRFLEDL